SLRIVTQRDIAVSLHLHKWRESAGPGRFLESVVSVATRSALSIPWVVAGAEHDGGVETRLIVELVPSTCWYRRSPSATLPTPGRLLHPGRRAQRLFRV